MKIAENKTIPLSLVQFEAYLEKWLVKKGFEPSIPCCLDDPTNVIVTDDESTTPVAGREFVTLTTVPTGGIIRLPNSSSGAFVGIKNDGANSVDIVAYNSLVNTVDTASSLALASGDLSILVCDSSGNWTTWYTTTF